MREHSKAPPAELARVERRLRADLLDARPASPPGMRARIVAELARRRKRRTWRWRAAAALAAGSLLLVTGLALGRTAREPEAERPGPQVALRLPTTREIFLAPSVQLRVSLDEPLQRELKLLARDGGRVANALVGWMPASVRAGLSRGER